MKPESDNTRKVALSRASARLRDVFVSFYGGTSARVLENVQGLTEDVNLATKLVLYRKVVETQLQPDREWVPLYDHIDKSKVATPRSSSAGEDNCGFIAIKDLALGRDLVAKGRFGEAEAILRSVTKETPTSAVAHRYLAYAMARNGDIEGALLVLEKVVGLWPYDNRVHKCRGRVLFELQLYEPALISYERAIDLEQVDCYAHSDRGCVLFALGRFRAALEAFDVAIRCQQGHASAHNNRAETLSCLDRIDDALASYDRALELDPRHVEAHNNRGEALAALSRHEEALESFSSAIQLSPDFVGAYRNRAILLHRLGLLEKAVDDYLEVLALDPLDMVIHHGLIVALFDLDRHADVLQAVLNRNGERSHRSRDAGQSKEKTCLAFNPEIELELALGGTRRLCLEGL